MALYIPHSIFHLARLLYVRPETFGPYYVYIYSTSGPSWPGLGWLLPLPLHLTMSYYNIVGGSNGNVQLPVIRCPRELIPLQRLHEYPFPSATLALNIFNDILQLREDKNTSTVPTKTFTCQLPVKRYKKRGQVYPRTGCEGWRDGRGIALHPRRQMAVVGLDQWFPTFFHLRTPSQPISINCTLHINKMFVINIVAVISNLYVVTVNCNCWRMCLFRHYSVFFRVPLNVLVRTPGW